MDELRKKLDSLQIVVSDNGDGNFTAYTKSEPLFCFVRNDVDELQALVVDTLKSYISTFYDAVSVEVEVVEQPALSQIPVREIRPIKRLAPRVGDTELACA